jgi:3-hydroxyacyl-[acyl-carrier-protein] dehydratase
MKADVENALSALTLTPDGASARLSFPRELPIFQGHFPGFPIVPGVYLVEAARLLAERVLARSLIIAALDMAKFSRAVGPEDVVEFTITLSERVDGFGCEARFRAGGEDAARIRLRLRPAGN